MALTDTLAAIKQLRDGPGETVIERTDAVLSSMGWDRQLARIDDEDFRNLIRHALERLALRHERDDRAPSAIEIDRQKKEREKHSLAGKMGDLYSDTYVGMGRNELAGKLPHETYFVPSLGRTVPREELAYQLRMVAELRKITAEELRQREEVSEVWRHELAIFDELLRQGRVSRDAAAEDRPLQ